MERLRAVLERLSAVLDATRVVKAVTRAVLQASGARLGSVLGRLQGALEAKVRRGPESAGVAPQTPNLLSEGFARPEGRLQAAQLPE